MSAGRPLPVAIVAALAEELAPLLARLSRAKKISAGGRRFTRGILGGHPVVVAVTGEGRTRAGHGARSLLSHVSVRGLLGIGVAGALSRDLSEGDILVARGVFDRSRGFPAPDPSWADRALTAWPGTREGSLVTVDEVLFDAARKGEVLAGLDAPEPAAVDLESAAWAQAAADAGVPYAVVRTIFDGSEESLPAFLAKCLGKEGRVSRARVIAHAATHPRAAVSLLALRRRMGAASLRLADFAERFLGEA
jgi:adenosylhomocysteine nucleosidase